MPNDGALMGQIMTWAPDEKLRRNILADNPSRPYGF